MGIIEEIKNSRSEVAATDLLLGEGDILANLFSLGVEERFLTPVREYDEKYAKPLKTAKGSLKKTLKKLLSTSEEKYERRKENNLVPFKDVLENGLFLNLGKYKIMKKAADNLVKAVRENGDVKAAQEDFIEVSKLMIWRRFVKAKIVFQFRNSAVIKEATNIKNKKNKHPEKTVKDQIDEIEIERDAKAVASLTGTEIGRRGDLLEERLQAGQNALLELQRVNPDVVVGNSTGITAIDKQLKRQELKIEQLKGFKNISLESIRKIADGKKKGEKVKLESFIKQINKKLNFGGTFIGKIKSSLEEQLTKHFYLAISDVVLGKTTIDRSKGQAKVEDKKKDLNKIILFVKALTKSINGDRGLASEETKNILLNSVLKAANRYIGEEKSREEEIIAPQDKASDKLYAESQGRNIFVFSKEVLDSKDRLSKLKELESQLSNAYLEALQDRKGKIDLVEKSLEKVRFNKIQESESRLLLQRARQANLETSSRLGSTRGQGRNNS
jgi:hypothetical protein